jgi:hypothetical protein
MRRAQLQRIGDLIGVHIARRYPFRTPEEAAISFLDFAPKEHVSSYEEYLRDFMESFIQAFICSCLERHPNDALRSMIPAIKKNTLSDVRIALMNDDYPLRFVDRDELLALIDEVNIAFFETLEFMAARREDAKTIYTEVVLRAKGVGSPFAAS